MNKKDSEYIGQIRLELLKKIRDSWHGWRCWRELRRIGEKGQFAIVLIPQGDEETSSFALAYLGQMLRQRKLDNAVIATNDPFVIKNCALYSKYILKVRQLTDSETNDLLQLYCLYRFDENFIVASLEYPAGRCGMCFVGVKGIPKEEIFAVGVYGLCPFTQEKVPLHQDDGPEPADFQEDVDKVFSNIGHVERGTKRLSMGSHE